MTLLTSYAMCLDYTQKWDGMKEINKVFCDVKTTLSHSYMMALRLRDILEMAKKRCFIQQSMNLKKK